MTDEETPGATLWVPERWWLATEGYVAHPTLHRTGIHLASRLARAAAGVGGHPGWERVQLAAMGGRRLAATAPPALSKDEAVAIWAESLGGPPSEPDPRGLRLGEDDRAGGRTPRLAGWPESPPAAVVHERELVR